MARGRSGVAKDKDKDKDREPDPKYALWIIAAIGKVKGQKQRPSEDRISHILETVYGLDQQVALEQLELCVKAGKVLKVVFKDKASYKDPAKVPKHMRGTVEKPKDFMKFIREALENVGDENGCTQQQIANYITDRHAESLDSSSDTQTRLKEALKKGLASSTFIKEGRYYRLASLPKVCARIKIYHGLCSFTNLFVIYTKEKVHKKIQISFCKILRHKYICIFVLMCKRFACEVSFNLNGDNTGFRSSLFC